MSCTFCCLSIDVFLNAKLSQRTAFLWQQARRKWHKKEEEEKENTVRQLWEIYMRQIDQISDWVNDRMSEWAAEQFYTWLFETCRVRAVLPYLFSHLSHIHLPNSVNVRAKGRGEEEWWGNQAGLTAGEDFKARNRGRDRQSKGEKRERRSRRERRIEGKRAQDSSQLNHDDLIAHNSLDALLSLPLSVVRCDSKKLFMLLFGTFTHFPFTIYLSQLLFVIPLGGRPVCVVC